MTQASFPRGPLFGVGVLLAGVLAAAGAARVVGSNLQMPPSEPIAAREIRFFDTPDGALLALDARDSRTIGVIGPGTNGFVRATMRSMGRARQVQGIGPEAPFRLTAWRDGRLTLDDSATGRRLELESFGITNETAFAHLLTGSAQQ